MKLEIRPETEVECYETISSLQSFITNTLKLLQMGAIPKGFAVEVEDARRIVDQLLEEIGEKFLVFLPISSGLSEIDKVPNGMISFWRWEEKMMFESFSSDFKKMICSACPFTLDLDHFIKTGGCIPCSLAVCQPRALYKPSACVLVSNKVYTQSELEEKIASEFGEGALAFFLQHQKNLI